MLLAESPFLYQPHSYMPIQPSPLSERSVNATPNPQTFSFRYASALMSSSSSSNLDAQKNVPFSKRAVKSAPTIIKDKDAVRERRRDLFMKKVASNRQDKKWESRGEQILRLDFVKEQKRWEAAKARSAPTFEEWLEEEEEDENTPAFSQQSQAQAWPSSQPISSQTPFGYSQTMRDAAMDEAEAEAMLEQERRELEELAALIEEERTSTQGHSSHFGSDDDDYDDLFMDYMAGQENQDPQYGSAVQENYLYPHGGDEEMDMS